MVSTSPSQPRRNDPNPNGRRTEPTPFWALSDAQQDEILYAHVEQAAKDVNTTAPDPSPAQIEVGLRDIAATLLMISAQGHEPYQEPDLDFMFQAKPDGSRSKQLAKLIDTIFQSATPANRLAHAANLLDEVAADCHSLGIVGENNLLLAIYLVGTSRLLERPLSAIVQGASSTGKSYVLSEVARLFPPEAVLHATRMTPQALYHMESVAHKFVVAGERLRNHDDSAADATGALRQLQSERRITKLITEKKDGKFTTRMVEQKGPIAYIETTTLGPGSIFPEDLNRSLLLKTDETEQQTRAILAQSAKRYKSLQSADVGSIVQKHRDFQSGLKNYTVIIPFASILVEKLPTKKVEARRVGQQILSMIEAVSLLHQCQREKDARGRLVAELRDYEIAIRILRQPLAESLGVKAGPAKLYAKLAAQFPQPKQFTTAQAQKLDNKAGDRTVRGWLSELADHGCIEQVQPSKGPAPAIWRLTGKRPEEAVLPAPELLELPGESRLKG